MQALHATCTTNSTKHNLAESYSQEILNSSPEWGMRIPRIEISFKHPRLQRRLPMYLITSNAPLHPIKSLIYGRKRGYQTGYSGTLTNSNEMMRTSGISTSNSDCPSISNITTSKGCPEHSMHSYFYCYYGGGSEIALVSTAGLTFVSFLEGYTVSPNCDC